MTPDDLIRGLPGEAFVRQGIADIASGQCTVPACLVSIAWTRLRRWGLLPDTARPPILEPEFELYRLLRQTRGDAYSRYNALVRELVSFEQALERQSCKSESSIARSD